MNTARPLIGHWNPWAIKLAEPNFLSTEHMITIPVPQVTSDKSFLFSVMQTVCR